MADPQWPKLLEELFLRLVSAARVTTPSCAHSAQSLPDSDVTTNSIGPSVSNVNGSKEHLYSVHRTTRLPGNRDTPDRSSDQEKMNNDKPVLARACDNCDTSDCHCLGDPEFLPSSPAHNCPDKVLTLITNTGHSDRQSLNPSTVLQSTQCGTPPDEYPYGERNASWSMRAVPSLHHPMIKTILIPTTMMIILIITHSFTLSSTANISHSQGPTCMPLWCLQLPY